MATSTSAQNTAQRLTLVTLVILALGFVGFLVYRQVSPQETVAVDASDELDLAGQPMLGDENAPVAIAVFEDFKCPACQFFDAEVMPQLERDLIDTGQVRFYFVNYPFIGPDSTTAAVAGECLYEQDPAAFFEYKTLLFRSQGPESEAWATPAFLADVARDNLPDIDANALQSCTEAETYTEQVAADREMGDAAGVQGTPAVFVNGELQESFQFADIESAVQAAAEAAPEN